MASARLRLAAGVAALALMVVGSLANPVGVASAAGPNLIVNGSFESPDVPTGAFAIFPSIPGWFHMPAPQATSSSGIEIQDHFAGSPADGAGAQHVELDSDGPSRVYQDVSTDPGTSYRLDFLYSPRPGTVAAQNHFQVSAGSEAAGVGPLPSTSITLWRSYTLDFVASGASSRVEFLDLGPEETTGGLGAYIDEVVVTALSPTSVAVRSFAAVESGRTFVLRWTTGSEARLVGFNVYRVQSGKPVKLNRKLIQSVFGGTATGHPYSWLDRSAPRGRGTVRYRLQAVYLDGTRSWVGAAWVRR